MKFFRIDEPDDTSDYTHTWVNGEGGPKLGFPGVECSVCGETGGLGGGLLPYRLPDHLADRLRALDYWPIPQDEHWALRAEVQQALAANHPDTGSLAGGESFPPIKWVVPTRPDGDVFWAGLGNPIVSARLAAALKSLGATGFELIPVDDVRCGTRSAAEQAPIPDSGEPEDLADWATARPEPGQEFFMLSVLAEGNQTSKMQSHPACTGCGRVETDRTGDWEAWEDSIWAGADVFHFPTTLYIIVTERVANLFVELGIANVKLMPLVPGERVAEPLWGEDDDDDEFDEDPPPIPRGPAVSGDLASDEDRSYIARLLEEKGLTITEIRRGEAGNPIVPDFKIMRGEKLMAYVLVVSLSPGVVERPAGNWLKHFWRFLIRSGGHVKGQQRFDSLTAYVREAVWRFYVANPDHEAGNVLVLVDHGSGLDATDLYDVLTAKDGTDYGSSRGNPEGGTGDEKLWLDLCLWIDVVTGETDHFGMPMSDVDRELLLVKLYDLGEKTRRG